MISYDPLWETMKQKNFSTYKLIQQGIDKRTIHHLKTNQNMTLLTLEKLVSILDCRIENIVEFKESD